jgi:hypothetical protein
MKNTTNNNNMNTTTSLTIAIKDILSGGSIPTVKEVLSLLSEKYPNVKASYRPVYGTLKRLGGVSEKVKHEAQAVVENIIFDLTLEPAPLVKGKVHKKGSRKALTA